MSRTGLCRTYSPERNAEHPQVRMLVSLRELDRLGSELIMDYRGLSGSRGTRSVDIEDFARSYLGLSIQYREFATGDPGDIGFYGDGRSRLRIVERGRAVDWLCPDRTIVIERKLLPHSEMGARRFTIAHEAAHFILIRHVPLQAEEYFLKPGSYNAVSSISALISVMELNERCADRLAAALLMPEFLVRRAMYRVGGMRHIPVYGNGIMPQDAKLAVTDMAKYLGVSYSAMLNRLGELMLIRRMPFSEYAQKGLRAGAV
ncbi:MAG: ImmA/IrrE family metallo-endopeptidase [Oscillospiraceae bacterium]|nr:ImmA/IrrE family metallo-endopeptidase [Oscillospiraceae bacterium]